MASETKTAWQTMESAPKDGRNVLLCFHHHPVAIGRFEFNSWTYAFCVTDGGDSPTGWMPVPEKDRPNIAAEYTEGLVSDMLAALKAVVRVADRNTDEFGMARAAISKAERTGPHAASVKRLERWQVPAHELDDSELEQELKFAAEKFDSRGEHGGSPGEFWAERMDEIDTEKKRRSAKATS